jgi:uncharacterized protein YbjQ (UPF0145 family)
MGNTDSKNTVNQTYETNIINKSDIVMLNKAVNKTIVDNVMNQAKSCSANISQLQEVKFDNINVAGDFNFTGNQKQTAALTFSCLQKSDVGNSIANSMKSAYEAALKNNFSSETIDKLSTGASTEAQGSAGTIGNVSAETNVKTNYKYNSETTINKNIQNIIENEINQHFEVNDTMACLARMDNIQSMQFKTINVGGNAIIAINQDQAATMLAECVQNSSVSTNVTQGILNKLGIETDDTNKVIKKMTSSTTTDTSAVNKGVIEAVGDAIAGIFNGMTGWIKYAIIGGVSLVSIIIIGILIFMIFGGGSEMLQGELDKDSVNNPLKKLTKSGGNYINELYPSKMNIIEMMQYMK